MSLNNHRYISYYWILLFLILPVFPTICLGHPHVFIDFAPTLQIDKELLHGIEMQWTFDRFTSEIFIEDIDKNRNAQVDPEEMPYFNENYRSIEEEANFFLSLSFGNQIFDNFEATLKRVFIAKNQVHYLIGITFQPPLQANERKTLLVEIEDPEFFVAFTLQEPASTVNHDGANHSSIRLNPLSSNEDCFAVEFFSQPTNSSSDKVENTQEIESVYVDTRGDSLRRDSFFKTLRNKLFSFQATYNRKLGDLVIHAKENFSWKVAGLLIAFSLFYGILHALGPGHGKSVVIGYFLQRKASFLQVVFTTAGISLIHTSSAVFLAFLFQTVLSSYVGMQRIRIQSYFSFVIACFILFAGIALFIQLIRKKRRALKKPSDSRQSASRWIFAAGLIPCPLSITVMLVAVTHNILFLGLITVISISAGMMIVLMVAGLMAMVTNATVYTYSSRRWGIASKLHGYLEFCGAIMIIVFGLGLSMLYLPKL